MEQNYIAILKGCPNCLSLEQFRAVAHISKRKAKWRRERDLYKCSASAVLRLCDRLEPSR